MGTQTQSASAVVTTEPDVWDALRHLAPRRPAALPEPHDGVQWQRVSPDRYRALRGEATVGFVDVVGAVFVVMAGTRYDRCVEVAQTLVFERAEEHLLARSR
ncbi:hypothetical protein AB0N73_09415 [Microbacterium sp. NPDC089189]|uniref:hypothetical protein n=1 Tax=Microbacterium sp. NPDC089189 TaxID=3154972 RepID=UPI0034220C56